MNREMELFLLADDHPFSDAVLRIACSRDCDVAYRLLHHVLIWRYMQKFFDQYIIPIDIRIPKVDSVWEMLRMEECFGWEIEEENSKVFQKTLSYCGWRCFSLQLDFYLPGDTPEELLREAIRTERVSVENYKRMKRFQDVVVEAYNLEFGNHLVLLSNPEIGWYKGFAETRNTWILKYFAKAHWKIMELAEKMAEPFYQQFSVHSAIMDEEYVVAFSMGREEEHFVDEEALDMNWIISAHIVHKLINIIREEWERKERRKVGYDASGTSGVCGVSEKI